jgi:hypothetical protein
VRCRAADSMSDPLAYSIILLAAVGLVSVRYGTDIQVVKDSEMPQCLGKAKIKNQNRVSLAAL